MVKIVATTSLHTIIPFTMICNLTYSKKSWILASAPHPVRSEGRSSSRMYMFISIVRLSACEISAKNIDNGLSNNMI